MQRESRLGRALWITLLVLLGGYVVSDFVRTPFLAPSGSAAVRPAQVTLWVPEGGAGDEASPIVVRAAAALELEGHTTSVKSIRGGSSEAVADFLSHPPEPGANLLVVTSATLADLAHDRRERLVPGAAEEAALAQELLRRAGPVGMLESAPLTIGVAPSSPLQSPRQVLAAIRSAPEQQLVAIADDTWSRVQLAALVQRAGVDGNVRFSVFQSGTEAAQAVESGRATMMLGTRGALRTEVRQGRLRELAWPFGAEHAPRFWVALVAAPALSPSRATQLRSWVAKLRTDRGWLARLREAGATPGIAGQDLAGLLRRDTLAANRLELLSRQIEGG